jgi:hypothetical protein
LVLKVNKSNKNHTAECSLDLNHIQKCKLASLPLKLFVELFSPFPLYLREAGTADISIFGHKMGEDKSQEI